jgi:predicted TIM-barrel fold metal-dependent hydrolase
MPNDGDLLDLLHAWVSDESLLRKILVETPARLYGFDDGERPTVCPIRDSQ